jgi:hypothetical protein
MSSLELGGSPATIKSKAARLAVLATLGLGGLTPSVAEAQPRPAPNQSAVDPQRVQVNQDLNEAVEAFRTHDYVRAYRVFTRLYANPVVDRSPAIAFNILRTSAALLNITNVPAPLALPDGMETFRGHPFATTEVHLAANVNAITAATQHNITALGALTSMTSIGSLVAHLEHIIPALQITDQGLRGDLQRLRVIAARCQCELPSTPSNARLRATFGFPAYRERFEAANNAAPENEQVSISTLMGKLSLYRDLLNAYYLIANRIHELNPSAVIAPLGIEPLFVEHLVVVTPYTVAQTPANQGTPIVPRPGNPRVVTPHPRVPPVQTPVATNRWLFPVSLTTLGVGTATAVVGGILAASGVSGRNEAVEAQQAIIAESQALARNRPLTAEEVAAGNARLATLRQQHTDATETRDNGTIALGLGLGVAAVGTAGLIYSMTRPSRAPAPAATVRPSGQRTDASDGNTDPQWTVTPLIGSTNGAQLTVSF